VYISSFCIWRRLTGWSILEFRNHYIVSKRRNLITHWRGIVSEMKGHLNSTTSKKQDPCILYSRSKFFEYCIINNRNGLVGSLRVYVMHVPWYGHRVTYCLFTTHVDHKTLQRFSIFIPYVFTISTPALSSTHLHNFAVPPALSSTRTDMLAVHC
jgi:hypothetical protein